MWKGHPKAALRWSCRCDCVFRSFPLFFAQPRGVQQHHARVQYSLDRSSSRARADMHCALHTRGKRSDVEIVADGHRPRSPHFLLFSGRWSREGSGAEGLDDI